MARAGWNFRVVAKAHNYCDVSTETRVLCASPEVRRRFLTYWWIIRPGSSAIQRAMLRAIRDHAEPKIPLGGITAAMIRAALRTLDGRIETEFNGTGADGGPTCATMKTIQWRVASDRSS